MLPKRKTPVDETNADATTKIEAPVSQQSRQGTITLGNSGVREGAAAGSLPNTSRNSSDETQPTSTTPEQPTRPQQSSGYLSDLQDWMANRRKEVSDALRSTLSPLLQPQETSIAAAMGMLLLPLLTERSATQLVKAIDRDVDLKLLRRNPNFSGRWIALSHKGKPTIIRRDRGELTLEPLTSTLSSELTCLPGFDHSGQAWLSQSVSLCTKPGSFIKELETTRMALLQSQAPEINWAAWIERHFDTAGRKARQHKDAVQTLNALKDLVNKATSNDPALADVVMLSQILDCADSLGLEKHRKINIKTGKSPQMVKNNEVSRSNQSGTLAFKQRTSQDQDREAS